MNDLPAPTVLDCEQARIETDWTSRRVHLRALLDDPTAEATDQINAARAELLELAPHKHTATTVECLLDIVGYMYQQAQSSEALPIASTALEYARLTRDRPSIRRALNVLGCMKFDCLDFSAIENFVEAIEVARSLGSPAAQAPTWTNLLARLQGLRQFGDAEACYHMALTILDAQSAPNERAFVWTNIAGCNLLAGRVQQGLEAARTSIAVNPDSGCAEDQLSRNIAESNAARLALQAGQLEEARQHASAARQIANQLRSPRTEYCATVAEAFLEASSEDPEAGLRRLRDTVEFARRLLPSEIDDALTTCIDAHEAAGQADIALVYVHELLVHNKDRIGEQLLAQVRQLRPPLVTDGEIAEQTVIDSSAKAYELEGAVRQKINDLLTAAITAAEKAGHHRLRIFRVARLAELFALAEGWSADRAGALAFAAQLCDLAMLVIPDELLRKGRGLSAGERKVMYEHTQFGAELLTKARLAVLQPCVPVAKFHHERWDGAGPWSLVGAAIPIEARFVSLADAFDALTHARPWRGALSLPAALRTITAEAGTRFDPELAVRFVAWIKSVYWDHDDFDGFLAEHAHENEYVRARAQIDRLVRGGA